MRGARNALQGYSRPAYGSFAWLLESLENVAQLVHIHDDDARRGIDHISLRGGAEQLGIPHTAPPDLQRQRTSAPSSAGTPRHSGRCAARSDRRKAHWPYSGWLARAPQGRPRGERRP